MSASAKPPLASTASTPPTLRASAERVAGALSASAGAWACYLALAERIGQTPRLLAMSGHAKDLPTWRALDGAALLRRAYSSHAPLIVRAGEWPALALPIVAEDQAIGVALRTQGLAEGGAKGIATLKGSLDVLRGSSAKLERARTMVELGAALQREGGAGDEARELLAEGLRIAAASGSQPLVERCERELGAAVA